MLVDSVMTRSVVTTEPSCAVESAALLMREHRFRHLPVVSHDRVVGIVSDRDLTRQPDRTVGQVMRSDVIFVTPDTPVEVAAKLMLDNKVGALTVVGATPHELAGIVTQSDLFAVLARLLGGDSPSTRLELRLRDLSRQLAQVTWLAHEQHIPITSLVTLPVTASDGHSRRVVLRIGTIFGSRFIGALHELGIEVNLPESPMLKDPARV